MKVLGLNAYHGDSAACLIDDGQLIAAVEEERINRIKHWAGFPVRAIEYCLREAGCALEDVEHVAVNRQPRANALRKAMYALRHRPSLALIKDRLQNSAKIRDIGELLQQSFHLPAGRGPKTHHVEHHVAHLASAFHVSRFERSAVVSVDGFGDFLGAMTAVGNGNQLDILQRVYFPHSLGLFYLALTQYLGFPHYGDEYKVMGLAAYGEPEFAREMEQLVQLNADGTFELGLDYFVHHNQGVTMTWEDGAPTIGPVYSAALEKLLGPARKPTEPVEQRHKNIAHSMQRRYEDAFYGLLRAVHHTANTDALCLAGGCAMNSVANGKIALETPFRETYIPPSPGDAGGAIGAAYYVWHAELNHPRRFVMQSPYWGPGYSNEQIAAVCARTPQLHVDAIVEQLEDDALCRRTAEAIIEGKVIGWHQGRMEWGPRALGNRSILVDPRRHDMKDILNARIKRRESFRPFAPAILEDYVGEYFEQTEPDPFMSRVYKVRPEKRETIPTAVHVDGTGRLQTVRRADNPRYWQVIEEFRQRTGVPILINTSFNENEPIVDTPEQAIDCFLRTKMDVLVLGSFFCSKRERDER